MKKNIFMNIQQCILRFGIGLMMLSGATVMMAPGAGFYSESGAGRDEVRMAYVLNKEDLGKALVVLEKALEQYKTIK